MGTNHRRLTRILGGQLPVTCVKSKQMNRSPEEAWDRVSVSHTDETTVNSLGLLGLRGVK